MGLGLIPIYMSIVLIALCGVAVLVGGVLLISSESRDAGRVVLRVSGVALLTGLVFTWAGMLPCGILWHFDERVAVLVYWASGPAGVVFGVVWYSLRLPVVRTRPSKEHD